MDLRVRRGVSDPDPGASLPEAPGIDETTALVNALRQGAPAAIAELFDRYALFLHRTLVRIIGDDDPESSDLLHDTFLRAVQHVRRLKNPQALKAWLRGIAVFTAQEWLRARKRMGHPRSPESGPDRPGVSAPPEAREAVRAVYAILDTLPHDERVVFVLWFIERMELTEIAEACRVSVSTVRRRIKRADRRFRDTLTSYPVLVERLKAEQ